MAAAATVLGCVFLPKLVHGESGLGCAAALVELAGIASRHRLRFILDRQYAVADGITLERQIHEPSSAFVRDDLKMVGLAADDHAESDKRTEAPASRRKCNRARHFERSGNRQHLVFVP